MRKTYIKLIAMGFLLTSSFGFEERDSRANLVNKTFAQDFIYQYSKSFFSSIEKYNKNRSKLGNLFQDMKPDDQKFLKDYLSKNKISSLPPINFKNDVATMIVGSNKISFTVGTLFEKNVYVNGKKILLPENTVEKSLEHFQKSLSFVKKRVTLIDLLISQAYAEDKLESATFAALLIINNNFKENEWCAFCEDEYLDATKKNFDLVMQDIQKRAQKCQTGEDEQEVLASKIDDFVSYDSAAYDLKEKMNTYFKAYTDESMTCEKIVKLIYSEQINSQMEAPGFYTGSVGKERQEKNQQKYDEFIVSKCQSYSDLRACIVNKTYEGKEVYNKLSGKTPLRYNEKLPNSGYKTNDSYKSNINR